MYRDVAVIVPTYNERANIAPLLAQLAEALRGFSWEVIFVDDDSPDGTPETIGVHVREGSHVRLLRRVGRRGLSSACIEGMMATQATFLAVMDADLQHDEQALPEMFRRLGAESLDVVVGTRNAAGGSMGDFTTGRVLLSQVGRGISRAVCRCELTDPMSGFFVLRRSFLDEVVHDLQGGGFKILVDLLASARRPVRLGEVGYRFSERRNGESKLDLSVGIEYLLLVLSKLLGDAIPVQRLTYVIVGGVGVVTHLTALVALHQVFHLHFVAAQVTATSIAMSENFVLNNIMTFREQRLRGSRIFAGAIRFALACSFGAWANVLFARTLWEADGSWYAAGLAGIVLGSVWNLSISSAFTWTGQRRTAGDGLGLELGAAVEVTQ